MFFKKGAGRHEGSGSFPYYHQHNLLVMRVLPVKSGADDSVVSYNLLP